MYRTILDPQQPQSLQGKPRSVLRRLATGKLDNAVGDQEFHDFMGIIFDESGGFPQLARGYVYNIAKPVIEFQRHYFP